jgi:hypothetical protein
VLCVVVALGLVEKKGGVEECAVVGAKADEPNARRPTTRRVILVLRFIMMEDICCEVELVGFVVEQRALQVEVF